MLSVGYPESRSDDSCQNGTEGNPGMTQSKYHAKNEFAFKRQRSTIRQSDDWQRDCDAIVRSLQDADRPLPRKEIQFVTMHGENGVRKRLDDLIEANRIRVRKDGPDGRVTYYEPTGRIHATDGEHWLPKPVRIPCSL